MPAGDKPMTAMANTVPPLGVMGASLGMKGKWMLSYRLMHSEWNGNRAGRQKISPQQAQAGFGFNLVPADMNVNMHGFSVMYTPVKKLSLMVMAPYITKWMGVQMIMPGGAVGHEFSMTTKGLGDVRTSALIELYNNNEHKLILNAGLSAPSGSIDRHDGTPASPSMKLPYIMQIGSGTWDVLPGLTYAGSHDALG